MADRFGNPASQCRLDDAELIVCCTDSQSNVVYVNPAFRRFTGFTREEYAALPVSERITGVPPQVMGDASVTLRSGRPWSSLVKVATRHGASGWCRLNGSPLFSKGTYIGSLMVMGKAGPDEISRIEALYKQLISGKPNRFGWNHGRLVRLDYWGRLGQRIRALGLRRHIAGTTAMLIALDSVALLAVHQSYPSIIAYGTALGGLWAATIAAGWYLSRAIVAPLETAIRFASRISAGDLSESLDSARCDQIGDLVRTLSQISVNLRATLGDVRDGVAQMGVATAHIAAGTVDLSARTETQAANLEQTAASMEEINAAVKQNADGAHRASELTMMACSAVEKSGSVVREVISTMESISQSSNRIAAINSVIDGIAFQTNILALNAAVEAARAGEAGRGFAVVASEVRNLAQRSARAAREIKALIAESADQVDTGSRLVDSAGHAIANVVSQVQGVSELVGQIALASSEQSTAVGQVSQGVEQLDDVTQENAALVEEHTSAANSLKSQAERLVQALCVFTLSATETNALLGRPARKLTL